MTPENLDLTIKRGVTFGPVNITCMNDAGTAALDITGYTAFAEARERPASGVAFDLAPTIPTGTDGKVRISKTDDETDELTAGRYGWDLILQNAAGARLGPYAYGAVTVEQPFTHKP